MGILYLSFDVEQLALRLGELVALQAGGHIVGNEGADNKDAVLHVAQHDSLLYGNELMIAAIVADTAPCQSLVGNHMTARLALQEVTYQVQTLLVDVGTLGIAVEGVLHEHRLLDGRITVDGGEIDAVASLLAPQCNSGDGMMPVVVPSSTRHAYQVAVLAR